MVPAQIALDGLRAAQAAAGSAEVSAIAAWIALAVNVIGLLFIGLQLYANRQALRAGTKSANAAAEAARIALMSERPWVQHWIGDDPVIRRDGLSIELALTWGWRNVGRTPAIRVHAFDHLIFDEDSSLSGVAKLSEMLLSPGPAMFPGEETQRDLKVSLGEMSDPEREWRLFLIVTYSIPGEQTRRTTACSYRVSKGAPAGRANKMYPDFATEWNAELRQEATRSLIHT